MVQVIFHLTWLTGVISTQPSSSFDPVLIFSLQMKETLALTEWIKSQASSLKTILRNTSGASAWGHQHYRPQHVHSRKRLEKLHELISFGHWVRVDQAQNTSLIKHSSKQSAIHTQHTHTALPQHGICSLSWRTVMWSFIPYKYIGYHGLQVFPFPVVCKPQRSLTSPSPTSQSSATQPLHTQLTPSHLTPVTRYRPTSYSTHQVQKKLQKSNKVTKLTAKAKVRADSIQALLPTSTDINAYVSVTLQDAQQQNTQIFKWVLGQ